MGAPVVTVAALHGSGGSVIGPRLAERLGVRFLDRAIPASVAERAGLTEEAVAAVDERGPRRRLDEFVSGLARVANPATAVGRPVERVAIEERRIRAEIEEFLAHAAQEGGVMLGRGGAVILRETGGALHVYLGGPREARVERVMETEGLDRAAADRSVRAHDRARMDYVQMAYGVDGNDRKLYHLMIDTTAIGIDACVELIASASEARRRVDAETS
jgi:cytidylate kinase